MKSIWVGIDWGTTNLRAWAIDKNGNILATSNTQRGMARLSPGEFELALLDQIEPWLNATGRTDVVICGMAGARSGWAETPYRETPCKPLSALSFVSPTSCDRRISVSIMNGIKTRKPRLDVIRGEETQIAGFLNTEQNFSGVICLPGTHTKWVQVDNGIIVCFQTFMSGEIFDLLARKSTLSAFVSVSLGDDSEFKCAVEIALRNPADLAAQLFAIRADALLDGLTPERASARLSGTIVGAELAACKPFWLGREIAIIGNDRVSRAYESALKLQGLAPRVFDVTEATVKGLTVFRKMQSVQV